jgi:hypothetical protein
VNGWSSSPIWPAATVFLWVWGANGLIATTDGLSAWRILPKPFSDSIIGVVYAGNMFVAMSRTGTPLTSLNGTDWTIQKPLIGEEPLWPTIWNVMTGLVTDGRTIVASMTSRGMTHHVYVSIDGLTWNDSKIDGHYIKGVTWFQSRFYLLTGYGASYTALCYEPNSRTWQGGPRSYSQIPKWAWMHHVMTGDTTFLVATSARWHNDTQIGIGICRAGIRSYAVSPDGSLAMVNDSDQWVETVTGDTSNRGDILQFGFTKSERYAFPGYGRWLFCVDGVSWNPVSDAALSGLKEYGGIETRDVRCALRVGDGLIVAGGQGRIYRKRFEALWSVFDFNGLTAGAISDYFYSVAVCNGRAVAAGDMNVCYLATDSLYTDWKRVSSPLPSQEIRGVCAPDSEFLFAADVTDSSSKTVWYLYRSKDGTAWARTAMVDTALRPITVYIAPYRIFSINGSRIMFMGNSILRNLHDSVWSVSSTTVHFTDVMFVDGHFIGIGSGSSVYLSNDGIAWDSCRTGFFTHLTTIGYDNDLIWIGGNGGLIASTPRASIGAGVAVPFVNRPAEALFCARIMGRMLHLSLTGALAQRVRVVRADGVTVASRTCGWARSVALPLTNMASGMYLIVGEIGGVHAVHRVMFVR